MYTVLQELNKHFERMMANLKSEISLLKRKFEAKDKCLGFVIGCSSK